MPSASTFKDKYKTYDKDQVSIGGESFEFELLSAQPEFYLAESLYKRYKLNSSQKFRQSDFINLANQFLIAIGKDAIDSLKATQPHSAKHYSNLMYLSNYPKQNMFRQTAHSSIAYNNMPYHSILLLSSIMQAFSANRYKTVVDFGAGEGVPLIMAAKLGAEYGIGFEKEPLLVDYANKNIKDNGLDTSRFKVFHVDLTSQSAMKIIQGYFVGLGIEDFGETLATVNIDPKVRGAAHIQSLAILRALSLNKTLNNNDVLTAGFNNTERVSEADDLAAEMQFYARQLNYKFVSDVNMEKYPCIGQRMLNLN